MDLKKQAATAALALVQPHSKIGLGAGSTMAHLVQLLATAITNGLHVSVYTSSFSTARLLQQQGIAVQNPAYTSSIDLYFDGCDQFDEQLNALKSGGGIHTSEKLLASMAHEFILVGDTAKYAPTLSTTYPLVIEVLPEAIGFAEAQVQALFPDTRIALRQSPAKDGAIVTDHGNYLLDVYFTAWPPLHTVNPALKSIAGIVETSLFYQLAQRAIVAGENGVQEMRRKS